MTKDGFWSGVFFGGLVGVAFTLMMSNKIAAEVVEAENEDKEKQNSDEEQGFLSELLSQYQKNNKKAKDGKNDGEDTNTGKNEAEEKEMAGKNTEKGKEEKLNIDKKISELEDALKQLREEKQT